MKTILGLLIAALTTLGQTTITADPPAAPIANVTTIGTAGFTYAYYMVVATYPSGTRQSAIVAIENGNAMLGMTNYNRVSWAALPGVLSYDVLKVANGVFTGSCTCSLTTATTATSYNDQGGSLSAYIVAAGSPGSTANIYLNTRDFGFTKMRVSIQNQGGALVDHLAEIPSGATLPTYCTPGDLFVKTGVAGGVNGCFLLNTWFSASVPPAPGTTDLGSAALPYRSLYLGTAATNNQQILPAATTGAREVNLADQGANGAVAFGDQVDPTKVILFDTHSATTGTTATIVEANTATSRTYTLPDASITIPGTVASYCGTTSTCAATNVSTTSKIVAGTAALVTGSPSTVTITGISPAFASTTSYACTANDLTTAANSVLSITRVSGSSITITGPNTITDTVSYICIGN